MSNEGGLPVLFPGQSSRLRKGLRRRRPHQSEILRLPGSKDRLSQLPRDSFPLSKYLRRDASPAWKKYYKWPDSYARFIQYIFRALPGQQHDFEPHSLRYAQISSIPRMTSNRRSRWCMNEIWPAAVRHLADGECQSIDAGELGPDSWVTLQQIGNRREHDFYWYLTEIYRSLVSAAGHERRALLCRLHLGAIEGGLSERCGR